MIVEIDVTKLGDIAEFQTGPFGTQLKASEYSEHGTPLINVKNIGYGTIIDDDLDFVPDAVCNRLNTHILHNGDIVFGRKGSIDRHGYIGKKQDGWMQGSDCIRMRVISDDFVPRYVSYCLNLTSVKAQISFASVGSTMDSLNTDILKNIRIPYLHLNEQIRIVSLLSDIDAKIDNNNAIAAELENMAKDLYDYWFVQFDFPDENGKPYKSSGGKMVWNEELKREIPEGWEVASFSKCIQSINTGLNPRDNFKLNTGGTVRYITVKNLTTNGSIDFSSCDFIDNNARDIVHQRSDISKGDILFASIAPLGRCFLIDESPVNWDINESVFSIRPNYANVTSLFLYMTFMGETFIKTATNSSTGSVFKGIRINDLLNMKTIIPALPVLKSFDKQMNPMFAMKSKCSNEILELASLRDFLLPMLMNGQVKVKGA